MLEKLKQREKRLWSNLKVYEEVFGSDSIEYERMLSQWVECSTILGMFFSYDELGK